MNNDILNPVQMDSDMLSYEGFRKQVLRDYVLAVESREASLLGRREVLAGKAKFGIFGDGKEVVQVAMAKFFQPGDFRSGYYRDQTFMFASEQATVENFFAQLYADPENDPFSSGRQMNNHFASPFVDKDGEWLDLVNRKNCSSDISPTAGQMIRGMGLAFASKLFRKEPLLHQFSQLSNNGNEICFCTIGDASTSEAQFWETINAAGVLQIPLAVFVMDDGYGISVPKKYQTTKESISEVLKGFSKNEEDSTGLNIYCVKGWDYAGMCELFEMALQKIRDTHTPAIFHIEELTQPQGHSTSGSHERYKSEERLRWEKEWDCIRKMREWLSENNIANEEELNKIDEDAKRFVRECREKAWNRYQAPIKQQAQQAAALLNTMAVSHAEAATIHRLADKLQTKHDVLHRDIIHTLSLAIETAPNEPSIPELQAFCNNLTKAGEKYYNTYLYNNGPKSVLKVPEVRADMPDTANTINGFEVLNSYFDQLFAANPKVVAFGEDLGQIGDVNQGFSGLQEKHGKNRIFDTGIRELTIIGQGIGLAMRGLRPIAEIQYLDYLMYGLQPLSDDVSTLHYRSAGRQSCPLIVRTRGHRLEGMWHSGSPMGVIINSLRGMCVCVPRNMVQAVGMYNTLLRSNDPGIVIECLNGYRLKEQVPNNLLEYTVPLGIPEIVKEGSNVTIVTYGSTLRIVLEATERLSKKGINCEVIDVRTLLPFDINHSILASLKKTNRIVFVDEDVPGGATAYMFNQVMEHQGGYQWLDAAPRTITAKAHRPAYGSDGDYFSKPNAEEIIEVVMQVNSQ